MELSLAIRFVFGSVVHGATRIHAGSHSAICNRGALSFASVVCIPLLKTPCTMLALGTHLGVRNGRKCGTDRSQKTQKDR